MKWIAAFAGALLVGSNLLAQTPESSPASSQLEALSKKVDEMNTKLDALSQEMLKLEQQISKPGVMVGEPTPAASAIPVASAGAGNTHVVARGETLTSIAKQYKVGIDELQKFNHIEDSRKLQAGQTILIPPPGANGSPTASPTAAASP